VGDWGIASDLGWGGAGEVGVTDGCNEVCVSSLNIEPLELVGVECGCSFFLHWHKIHNNVVRQTL
jgi:hypothetical protein